MEKKYVCPVCNQEVANLEALNKCIIKHMEYEKQNQEAEKQSKIDKLKAENEKLIGQIKRNCDELNKLGIIASVNYNVGTARVNKINNSSNKSFKYPFNEKEQEDIEKFIKNLLNCLE